MYNILLLEVAKTKACLDNLITSIRVSGGDVDVLGSLLVLHDQLDRLDDEIDKI